MSDKAAFTEMGDANAKLATAESKIKRLTVCATASMIVAVAALCLAAFAAAGGMKHEGDIGDITDRMLPLGGVGTAGPEVVLRVGASASMTGYPSKSSLYDGAGFWTTKKPLPTATSDFAAVHVGDKVYLIGGQTYFNNTAVGLDTLTMYDTALEKYSALTKMPEKRMRYGAAVSGGKIFVMGGLTADGTDQLNTTLIYDIATNAWTYGPQMVVPRGDTCAAAAGGKIYVVAGFTTNYATLKSVEVMDPAAATPVWTKAADLPEPRGDVTCAASGDKVYALGGYYDASDTWKADSFHNSVFELDAKMAMPTWVTKAPMPTARGDKAAVTLADGSIVVIGGESHARNEVTQIAQHAVEQYFPAHNTWMSKASIPTARFRFAAAAVGQFIHAFGGHVLCESGWFGNYNDDCAKNTLDSHEVLMDVAHPDVWIHASKM
mmetsp:Transcript_24049/g.58981  ORF Transcript_24049/g.58981 Transcript_24049/m.58981 type:complete len:435 (-) Transcript_24049:214-1518(-)|eukprot:CAMPEP_0197575364 /NCGR_PEP_ID=MMETSP1326-20131121/785_1 /TAXON_ID=1155430 /ORGANISM="Genus nov. species nov., Strain RCC2288" /LENGTH=434 /DNA_ID=CAMNT_0043138123 /DNA_START=379 /DNA_END=1683 /DNA_ORIENTATION=-